MPKIPRTPQGQPQPLPQQQVQPPPQLPQQQQDKPPEASSIEALLMGMEARLGTHFEKSNEAIQAVASQVKQANEGLNQLEQKVDESDANFKVTLQEVEARVLNKAQEADTRLLDQVRDQVKEMVENQLRAAGFDPDMTAAGLSTINQTPSAAVYRDHGGSQPTYAGAVIRSANMDQQNVTRQMSKEERQEEKFWNCRRSLRVWPVPDADRNKLNKFFMEKLHMDINFLENEMGDVHLWPHRDPKAKIKDEVYVTFESREIRDAVNPLRPRSFFQFRPFRPRGRKRPMEVSFLNLKNILKIIKK